MKNISLVVALLSLTLSPAFALKKVSPFAHPLDPLTKAEIAEAVKMFKAHPSFSEGTLFPTLALQEPDKNFVKEYKRGQKFQRQAFATLYDRKANATFEAIADLTEKKIISFKKIDGVQPGFLVEELTSAPEIIKADPRYIEAMKKRGITNLSELQVDGWAPGTVGVNSAEGPRLVRILTFYKGKSSNIYGRPVEGVVAVVDMNQRKVVDFVDTGVVPISKDDGAYDEAAVKKAQGKLREAPKPLKIVMPQGASYKLEGNLVKWQKWQFRFAMHPREGLIIHEVAYNDEGTIRPIMYRGSLSEMVVPYGDPDKLWSWRSAFDVGEYGIGRLASPYEKNIDAPENAQFFDAEFVDDLGKAYTMPRAVALYERDGGLLWKHYDINSNKNQSRRARQLVISFLSAVGNYDYGVSWIFNQDGIIDVQCNLTGIMLSKGVTATSHTHADDHHSHKVSETTVAPHHQHFFNFRLDMDVDSTKNKLLEMNTSSLENSENPDRIGIKMETEELMTEKDARRNMNLETVRRWIMINESKKNSLGHSTGYALLAGDNAVPFIKPDSLVRKRAGFVDHHFWTTVYKSDEFYSGGMYPNQSRGGDGLTQFVSDNQKLSGQDLVMWYTAAVTHIPRPEEWPIMSRTDIGFKLVPAGFFSRNPSLDVPIK